MHYHQFYPCALHVLQLTLHFLGFCLGCEHSGSELEGAELSILQAKETTMTLDALERLIWNRDWTGLENKVEIY